MVRCWKLSEPPCMEWGPTSSCKFPHRMVWGPLTGILLIVIITLSVALQLRFQHDSQAIRITFSDQMGNLINQSAFVDKQRDVVTYSLFSQINHTSTVLFDMKHGLICYKQDNRDTCFLQRMEGSDYENVHTLLNNSNQQVWLLGNETRRQREFLGVLAGSRVDSSSLEEPIHSICQQSTVYWTKRANGPGKQRLIYFCIDICFPSNICVSVCFYYLPE